MEENQVQENHVESKSNSSGVNPLIIIGVVLVAVLVGFGLFSKKTAPTTPPIQLESTPAVESPAGVVVQTINVEGGMYYYKPNEITVKVGQPVKIVFNNVEGMHDFVLDEFNVRTDRISAGQTTEVTFTPDKTGSFEFYCNVGQHRAMGMKGTLVVE
jgi:plastocyanin